MCRGHVHRIVDKSPWIGENAYMFPYTIEDKSLDRVREDGREAYTPAELARHALACPLKVHSLTFDQYHRVCEAYLELLAKCESQI